MCPNQAGPIDVEPVDKLRQTMLVHVRETTVILEDSNSVGAGYFGLVPNSKPFGPISPQITVTFLCKK